MPGITLQNTPAGPLITVFLAPSSLLLQALTAAGVPHPQPVQGTFLVDTGASQTVVDTNLIAPLNLNPVGAIMCHTPSTAGQAVSMLQYDLMVYVPPSQANHAGWHVDSIPVVASSFAGQPIHGLIGRDILDKGLLIYNGSAGHFTIAY